MFRREILTTTGASLAALTGCASSSTQTPLVPAPPPTRSSPSYPIANGELDSYDPERVVETIRIGNRAGVQDKWNNQPYHLRIWNATRGTATFSLRITNYSTHSTSLDSDYDLPPDTALHATLLTPATYTLTLQHTDSDTQHNLRVPRRFFDCNSSSTTIVIFQNDTIKSSASSSDIGCGEP